MSDAHELAESRVALEQTKAQTCIVLGFFRFTLPVARNVGRRPGASVPGDMQEWLWPADCAADMTAASI